jgi:hypothetical protein
MIKTVISRQFEVLASQVLVDPKAPNVVRLTF